jgi:CNT family concentrative nucleoside transporter
MERFHGLIGIALIFGVAFLFSNNRSRINYRVVFSGLLLQVIIAVLVLKVTPVAKVFQFLDGMEKIEQFAFKGASFVYEGIAIETGRIIGSYARRIRICF